MNRVIVLAIFAVLSAGDIKGLNLALCLSARRICEWGTTLRFYHPRTDAWHVVWSGPM
jgi:hypothetical protein